MEKNKAGKGDTEKGGGLAVILNKGVKEAPLLSLDSNM